MKLQRRLKPDDQWEDQPLALAAIISDLSDYMDTVTIDDVREQLSIELDMYVVRKYEYRVTN